MQSIVTKAGQVVLPRNTTPRFSGRVRDGSGLQP